MKTKQKVSKAQLPNISLAEVGDRNLFLANTIIAKHLGIMMVKDKLKKIDIDLLQLAIESGFRNIDFRSED